MSGNTVGAASVGSSPDRRLGALRALVELVPPWMEDALCAQTDPEAFFPEKGGSTRAAKAVCAVCPVRLKCLEWALENDDRFGIYGGLSERERRKLKPGKIGRPRTNPERRSA